MEPEPMTTEEPRPLHEVPWSWEQLQQHVAVWPQAYYGPDEEGRGMEPRPEPAPAQDLRRLCYVRGAFPAHVLDESGVLCYASWAWDYKHRLVAECPHYRYRHEEDRARWQEEKGEENA